MENNNQGFDLDLMSFDLGEDAGGKQLILAHKSVSETEHYVFTVGDGVKNSEKTAKEPDVSQEPTGLKKLFSKQSFLNLRDQLIRKKPDEKEEENNIKLRCFNLTLTDNGKYLVKEFVTPEGVAKVAKMFNFDKNESDLSK